MNLYTVMIKKRCGFLLKPLTDEGLLNPVTSHFSFFKCIHLHHNTSMLIQLSKRQFPAQPSSPFGSLERDPAPSVILAGRIPHHQRLDSIGAMDPSISLQGLKLWQNSPVFCPLCNFNHVIRSRHLSFTQSLIEPQCCSSRCCQCTLFSLQTPVWKLSTISTRQWIYWCVSFFFHLAVSHRQISTAWSGTITLLWIWMKE